MLTEVLEDLRAGGILVDFIDPPDPAVDAVVELVIDGKTRRLAVERRARAPYPGELSTLFERRDRLGQWGTPTLVAPYIPESVGNRLIPLGWSWADEEGNHDLTLGKGLRLRHRGPRRPVTAEARSRRIPRGPGGLSIVRALIEEPASTHRRTRDLAELAGVTAARASQVLSRLGEMRLVRRHGGGWVPERDALLGAFLRDYGGPGGIERLFYSLDSPTDAAAQLVSPAPHAVAVSADVGPDVVAPWRRPTTVVVYVPHGVRIDTSGLVPTTDRGAANVRVRVPDDTSVFWGPSPLLVDLGGRDVRLAAETQMIWDLHDLGGDDRREAADALAEWVIERTT